jgi:exodeoxyribonuclease V gamma subunit
VLRLIRSHSIESLADSLAEQLSLNPPADPLVAQQVLVSTNAMGRWLALALSERLGICAGIDFDFGGRYLRQLVRDLDGQPQDQADPWDPVELRWRLATLLENLPDTPIWEPLKQLWHRRGSAAALLDRHRLQLVLQLADTLDQYGLYRPEPMLGWLAGNAANQGAGIPLEPSDHWQPALLRQLQLDAKASGFTHPSERLLQAARSLPSRSDLRDRWQQQGPLQVFGLSSLPPALLQLLAGIAAADLREVVLYQLSPCQNPWGEPLGSHASGAEDPLEELENRLLQSGHPLVANLGRCQRDFHWQLELIATNLQERFSATLAPPPPIGDQASLLEQLRSDLWLGTCRSEGLPGQQPPLRLKAAQVNMQVISCHGDRRQVEEAHRAVLALMAQQPELEPRHVLLMTADVARFTPLVLAVFERPDGPADPRHLPVRVTDRTLRQRNPRIDLLFRLLQLAGGRLEREEVLDLLLLPPVASQLQLDDLPHHQWLELLEAAGITWGRDGEHRRNWGYGGDHLHSWRWGLDRLLLGIHLEDRYPAAPAAEGEWQGLAACGDPRATASRVLALHGACAVLFPLLAALEQPLSPAGWNAALAKAVNQLSGSGGDEGWQAPELYDLLRPLRKPAREELRLSREAVIRLLEEAEAEEQGRYGHVSGAVTLSALEPMRSIPHPVVVLLGMDEQRLPRRDYRPSFDLMARHPWRGDRDRRQEDRGILLETLQACRSHWIATYTGIDPRTAEQLNPAGPLADLLSSLERSYRTATGEAITAWVLRQAEPLATLPEIAAGGACSDPYPQPLWPANLRWPAEQLGSCKSASLEELQQFWRDPTRELLRAHGIQVQSNPGEQPDPEETQADSLKQWQLGQQLLQLGADQLSEELWPVQRQALVRRGFLPAEPAAQMASQELLERSQNLLALAAELHQSLGGAATLQVSNSQLRPKRLLEVWIAHLTANCAQGHSSVLVGPTKLNGKETLLIQQLKPLIADQAEAEIHRLQQLRLEGLSRPICFAAELSWWLLLDRQQAAEAAGQPLPGLTASQLQRFRSANRDQLHWPASLLQLHRGVVPQLDTWLQQPEAWEMAEQVLLPLSKALAEGTA